MSTTRMIGPRPCSLIRRAVSAIAVAALLAACASTERPRDGVTAAADATPSNAADALAAADVDPGAPAAPAATSASNGDEPAGGPVASAQPTAGQPSAATPVPAPPAATSGEPVRVGFIGESLGQYQGAIGGLAIGDTMKSAAAVTKWINEHGGAGGRRLELVPTLITRGADQAAQEEAACNKYTQDEDVLAVLAAYSPTSPSFQDCFVQAGMPYSNAVFTMNPETAKLRSWKTVYSPGASRDRTARSHVDALIRLKYFADAGMKLGVVTRDDNLGKSYAASFRARLADHGIEPAAEASICYSCGNRDAQMRNAVLKFRQEGVTHVSGDQTGFGFVPVAAQQSFLPRYGVSTEWLPFLLAIAAPAHLQGAVGLGVWQEIDVQEAQEPPPTPGKQLCRQLMAEIGEPQNRLAQANAAGTCDVLLLVKSGFDHAPEFTIDGLRAGIASIGSDLTPVMAWKSFFSAERFDGAETYRPLAYDAGCTCFTYVGDELNLTPAE